MHITTLLALAALAFLAFKLFELYFGRFGRKSRFKLWRKFRNGHVAIYVVEPRRPSEARGNISPATFYRKLKLTFAAEADMRYLAGLDLPSGIDISSCVRDYEVISLHFVGKNLCQIEKRKSSVFLKGELYALVDAERPNTEVPAENNMAAA